MKRISFSLLIAACCIAATSCGNNNATGSANGSDSGKNGDSVNQTRTGPTDTSANSNASSSSSAQTTLDTADETFIRKAASGGQLEVLLGGLAGTQGNNPRVKNFGQMMIKDHTDANAKLKNVAQQLHVNVPDSQLLPMHQHHRTELASKKGTAFDKAYIKMMVEDHKEDISDFEKASNSKNQLVKDFATQTLPVLRVHLDSATAINKKM